MHSTHHRREFLERLGIGSAGLLLGGYASTARGFAANDTINVGCIGTGGRCRHLLKALVKIPGVRIAGVCDIWDQAIEETRQYADPKALFVKEMERLLESKDIDAVLIASPDHWHVPMTIAACGAGKDVYVEKPLTHSLEEGQSVIDAQNKHKKIVQVGTQQRSMTHFLEAEKIVRSGELGDIFKVHLTWNRNQPRWSKNAMTAEEQSKLASTVDWKRFLGNAPEQPFDPYRFRNWRWFWDFGGGIFTDLMVHFIDVAHWFLGLDHHVSAASIGDHFRAKDMWETPDSVQTILHYAGADGRNMQIYFEGTFVNARNAAMLEFMGSEATLYLDRGRYEIIPERNKKIEAREMILGAGPKGQDFYDKPDGETMHLNNWLECIRSREKPHCPAEAGVSAASAAHLANAALRSGEVARWK